MSKLRQNFHILVNFLFNPVLPVYTGWPGASLRYFKGGERGGGGVFDRGSYFVPPKNQTSEFVYPKIPYVFSIPPKKPHQQ